MHAVLIEVDASGADPDVALTRLRDEIIPSVKQAPGFQSGTWLRPNEERRGFGLVLFDSEENAKSAASRFAVGESLSRASSSSAARCARSPSRPERPRYGEPNSATIS